MKAGRVITKDIAAAKQTFQSSSSARIGFETYPQEASSSSQALKDTSKLSNVQKQKKLNDLVAAINNKQLELIELFAHLQELTGM